jgi:aminomethyltransferase
MSKRTPLFEKHQEFGAKMIDFGGFDMPVQYEGIKQEHLAVRQAAGLFDVSHMGEFVISGPESLNLIQKVTINDASKLKPGDAQYSAMCYEHGGIVDDLIIYKLAEDNYMLVVNASNIKKDLDWIRSHNNFDAVVTDISDKIALLALQGPKSVEILEKATDLDVSKIDFYNFETGTVAGQPDVIVSATGYTGEKGFELYIDTENSDPVKIWDAIFRHGTKHGLMPVGLGARDTLRLEMGFALYGNDITEETTPLEGRLGWLTKLDKNDFIGSEALKTQKNEGLKRKLVGFKIEEARQIPRTGYDICDEAENKIGFVTSGTQSISLGIGIGMGYVPIDNAKDGSTIYIKIRKNLIPAIITKPPFYRNK